MVCQACYGFWNTQHIMCEKVDQERPDQYDRLSISGFHYYWSNNNKVMMGGHD